MDIKLIGAEATDDERQAVDALLGQPDSAWHGGERGVGAEGNVAFGGQAMRAKRHLLLPALWAVQQRVGWISEGALDYVCTRLDVAPADAWGVATFYALIATSPRPRRVLHVCDDIACRCKGAAELAAQLEKSVGPAHGHAVHGDHVEMDPDKPVWMRSPCLGLCDRAPAAFVQDAGEVAEETLLGEMTLERATAILNGAPVDPTLTRVAAKDTPTRHDTRSFSAIRVPPAIPQAGDPSLRLLKRVGTMDPTRLDAYKGRGGYAALARAIELGGPAVIREVVASKLMGRGGAAFPTGRKWEAVAGQQATPHYLICNADESEPGTFKDRVLLERDPFAVVESMTIAAYATGCSHGYLYIRGEYPLGARRIENALAQAREAGLLGSNILGTGFDFDIEVRRGAGAYICGEETAIFNSIEGYRGEPRNKPPFPVQAGLFGKPTVVNNVETLVNVLPIVLEGGDAFAKIGTAQSTGTKLFCLSGSVQRPGVYELAFGATLRQLLEMAGGVPEGRTLQAILLGGAAGVFVGPAELDIPLTFEGVREAKATLGSGVIMAFDDSVNLNDVLMRIAGFFRDESCGQCVPCRVGTVRQEEALHRIVSRKTLGSVDDEIALLDEVGLAMKDASICGLGQTAYGAIESAIHRLGVFAPKAKGGVA